MWRLSDATRQCLKKTHTGHGGKRQDSVPNEQREKRHAPTGAPDARSLGKHEADQHQIEQQREKAAARFSVPRPVKSEMRAHPRVVSGGGVISGWQWLSPNVTCGMVMTVEAAVPICSSRNTAPTMMSNLRL
jgi:hypothetical protein